ncbi:GumC family protein [Rhodoligotrophos defluvii]|uniref:GumC family protein n=1 Tax=Rhodoligotrophos defluvii TaxID=2561934 RepID=UPI0010C9C3D1|nr:exopolysaccharide transport family protein [Rhodoligotrophos defluvii]
MTRDATDGMEADRPLVAAVDLFGLLQGMWRRKLLMLFVLSTVVGATVAYIATTTPKYKAEAEVLIENTESAFTRTSLETQPRQLDERDIASQVQVMQSGEIAERVVKALDLTSKPEFQFSDEEPNVVEKWLIEKGLAADPRTFTPLQQALEIYYDDLQVYPIGGSKVVSIAFTTTNPQLAADVANAVADQYVNSTRQTQSETTSNASEWLAQQIEQLRDKVVASERAVEEYRAQAGLLQGSQSMLSNESLTELNNQIIQAAAQKAEARARADSIRTMLRDTGQIDSSVEVLNSPLMQRLIEREVTLRGSRDDLLVTLLPTHPRIVAINNELAGLQRQIRQEALKIAQSQEQQAEIAEAREAALTRTLNDMKAQAADAKVDEVKLRALEREAAANRNLLETFLGRYSDASARESTQAQPSLARVISPATAPVAPASPKPIPLLALAALGGTALAFVIAFIAEIFSLDIQRANATSRAPRLSRDEEQPRRAPAPLPALPSPTTLTGPVWPKIETRELSGGDTADAAAGAIIPVIAEWHSNGVKRVLLGSDRSTAIASETIAEIGRGLSRRHERVILVDLDPASGALAGLLGTGTGSGLSELMAGKATFSDTIKSDLKSDLHVLRGGLDRGALANMSEAGRMGFVLNALGQAYDLVLLVPGMIDGNTALPTITAGAAAVVATSGQPGTADAIADQLAPLGVKHLALVKMAAEPAQSASGEAGNGARDNGSGSSGAAEGDTSKDGATNSAAA